MRIYKLRFLSGLHVDSKGSGEPETAEEFIRSDTLSAALCLAWSDIFPQSGTELFLHPPFRISSAFPFIGNSLLFPVPQWPVWKDTEPAQRKKTKKIKWFSQTLFEQALAGKTFDPDENKKEAVLHNSGIAFSFAEKNSIPRGPFWKKEERQRVSVDRLGLPHDGGLFFFSIQFFAPDSGLWFAADIPAEMQKKMRAALDYLGDTGIGADRSSGLGHFQVMEEKDWQIAQPKNAAASVLLSLFNPGDLDKVEQLIRKSAYGLDTRSGWVVNSTLGRPPIRVFTEGSCFSDKPEGRVVEMLDAETKKKHGLDLYHTAPRDFRAFCLACAQPGGLREVNP